MLHHDHDLPDPGDEVMAPPNAFTMLAGIIQLARAPFSATAWRQDGEIDMPAADHGEGNPRWRNNWWSAAR